MDIEKKKTYLQRFREVVKIITGEWPPETMANEWLEHQNDDLQGWVLNALGDSWPQGIAVLDAAQLMADQPKEGPLPQICYKRPAAHEMKEQIGALTAENSELQERLRAAESDKLKLAKAIAKCAGGLGMYNGEVSLTGPHLLMLLGDITAHILQLRQRIEAAGGQKPFGWFVDVEYCGFTRSRPDEKFASATTTLYALPPQQAAIPDESILKIWAHGYDRGHNDGIGCGHDLAPRCRHDSEKEAADFLDDVRSILSAAPSLPVEQVLDKPARVGGTVFSSGVKERLVIECAQRHYELKPSKEIPKDALCFHNTGEDSSKHYVTGGQQSVEISGGGDENNIHKLLAKCSLQPDELTPIVLEVQKLEQRISKPSPNKADVPEGWKCVPVEPTNKMIFSGLEILASKEYLRAIYGRMLNAAPPPQDSHHE